jgi:DNA polymerase (family X)
VPRANDDVEAVLLEYADLLAILSEDSFKPRAYEKAARAVGGFPADVAGFDSKQLQQIPNVGKSIAEKAHEFLRSGTIGALDELRGQVPPGVRDMMAIPGLGPKKAMALYWQLGIASPDELLGAIEQGALAGLKGFGSKTAENVLRGLEQLRSSSGRVSIAAAMDVADGLVANLGELRQVRHVAYAGSLRRMAETIGDVDLLVAGSDPAPIMKAFTGLALAERVLASGDTKSSIVTSGGLQVDLRVVTPEVWGAALIYFTGSKSHNIRIREIAVRKGFKLSEWGLFRAKSGKLLVAETEEEVYERLGLAWIPPPLREDRGEIEAAAAGDLPRILQPKQIRGDLHTHTNLTDGLHDLSTMITEAAERGYAYYAVTDHAPNLWMQRMTDEKILAQRVRLRKLAGQSKMELLHGAELNIDADGGLDWDDAFLDGFDVLVASVHSHFTQAREDMTRRIVRAIENPHVNIIGHPTARKLGKRPPVEFDEEEVFRSAARTGTALEVNSHPDRLDLKDEHLLWARRLGVKFAVNTDAHAVGHLALIRFGVGTAQRGWLTKDDVINAWPLSRLRTFLRKGRAVS